MRYRISYREPDDSQDQPKRVLVVPAPLGAGQASDFLHDQCPNAEQVVVEAIGDLPEQHPADQEHQLPSPPPPHRQRQEGQTAERAREIPRASVADLQAKYPRASITFGGPYHSLIMQRADINVTDNPSFVTLTFDKTERYIVSEAFARELGQRLIAAAEDINPSRDFDLMIDEPGD